MIANTVRNLVLQTRFQITVITNIKTRLGFLFHRNSSNSSTVLEVLVILALLLATRTNNVYSNNLNHHDVSIEYTVPPPTTTTLNHTRDKTFSKYQPL